MRLIKIDKEFCNKVDRISLLIEKKYFSVLIGILIMEGPKHFNELKKTSGLSAKTLNDRLSELVDLEIIDKEMKMKGKVKKQLYSPNQIAFEYYEVMRSMVEWGDKLNREKD